MIKVLLIFVLTVFSIHIVSSQTATIHARVVFPNEMDTVDYIRFKINNHIFGEKDTIIQIRPSSNGLDTCEAIIASDTIKFLTKFRVGEVYNIRQGCCCAAFNLEPINKPRRGTVTFKNVTKRDLSLVVAEANVDTVKTKKTQTTFSHESVMCMFKPCSILITETAYLSDDYNYKNDTVDYNKLWLERDQQILSNVWFHFLHGEKIEIYYSENNREIKIKLKGYLTDKEYSKNLQ